MKKILSVVMLSWMLAACSEETGSYAIIIVINDIEYGGTEETLDGYEIDKIKGTITKKVPADVFPANNQSNVFEAGTTVYSVKGENAFVIVEEPDGQKHLMQRAPSANNK